MPRIFLINSDDFPCPGSHLLHTRKFLKSFENFGFTYGELNSTQDIAVAQLSSQDVVYFSNHGVSEAGPSTQQLTILEAIRLSGAFPIFWFWQRHSDLLSSMFGSRWILTGEHYRAQIVRESHEEIAEAFRKSENYVPLTFAASMTPEEIMGIEKKHTWDASFVGHRYQPLLNAGLLLSKHKVSIRYTPPFISEEKRVGYFKDSLVMLGWHSLGNIANGVVVERVFEGLAYGCVVVTDNPYALEATDGNAIFSTNRVEIIELIGRLKRDESLRASIVAKGRLWAASHGTYRSVTEKFLERIKS